MNLAKMASGVIFWPRAELPASGRTLSLNWLGPASGRSRYMTGYTWDLAHLHWNCTKLISYWSWRSTVVQFYPQDQRSSIQTPAPSIPTVYHLYCTSCIKHILFLANGRLSRHLDIFLILDLQTFPLIWSAPLKLVEPSKKVLHGAFPVCRSPTGLM